jgi:hypothetical protein
MPYILNWQSMGVLREEKGAWVLFFLQEATSVTAQSCHRLITSGSNLSLAIGTGEPSSKLSAFLFSIDRIRHG